MFELKISDLKSTAELLSLTARVQRAIDDKKLHEFRACIARDCTWLMKINADPPIKIAGRDNICTMAAHTMHETKRQTIHQISASVVDILGDDKARLRSNCLYVLVSPGSFQLHGTALFVDDAVFEDGAWRLQARDITASVVPETESAIEVGRR